MKNEATASGSKRMNLLSQWFLCSLCRRPKTTWTQLGYYTKLKLDRLQGWLNQQPLPGFYKEWTLIVSCWMRLILLMTIGKQPCAIRNRTYETTQSSKSAVTLLKSKVRRTKTELWSKRAYSINITYHCQNWRTGTYRLCGTQNEK